MFHFLRKISLHYKTCYSFKQLFWDNLQIVSIKKMAMNYVVMKTACCLFHGKQHFALTSPVCTKPTQSPLDLNLKSAHSSSYVHTNVSPFVLTAFRAPSVCLISFFSGICFLRFWQVRPVSCSPYENSALLAFCQQRNPQTAQQKTSGLGTGPWSGPQDAQQ